MSKSFIGLCCSAFLMFAANLLASNLPWQTNYETALQQAKASSKPMLLFFTGSDWCSWCTKLEQEVFNTQEFAQAAGNKFIFVLLDFPQYSAQDPQLKAKNKELQQRFNVRSYPTVVLFNAQQNQKIGTTGYRPGGGKQYADFLIQMTGNYSAYKESMDDLNSGKLSGNDLKQLYEQANKLQLDADAQRIVQKGMNSSESLFFMTEKYRILAEEGNIGTWEAHSIRQHLLAADLNNKQFIPYQVAMIEFEAYHERMDSSNQSIESVIAPLTAYIKKYGAEDKEHLWKLQMIIAQAYLENNQVANALKYAKESYEVAPQAARSEIAKVMQDMTQTHSSLAGVH